MTEDLNPDWLAEFEAAARRPLAVRWRYAFIHTYKPVLDLKFRDSFLQETIDNLLNNIGKGPCTC